MDENELTATLDKEIRESARIKAERILQNADVTCEKIEGSLGEKVAAFREEKKIFYDKLIEEYRKSQFASIPLEEARMKISFEDQKLRRVCRDFFDILNEDERLQLIEKMLILYKPVLEKKSLHLVVNQFDVKKVKDLVIKTLNATIIDCVSVSEAEASTYEGRLGILIKSEEGDIRCRATLSELARHVLDENRLELASVLFSAGV